MTGVKTEIIRSHASDTAVAPTTALPYSDTQAALLALRAEIDAILATLPAPGSTVDNTVPRFVGTDGALEDTGLTISDTNFLGGTLNGVGIGGATADATNRLSANTPAVLFNRETANIQVKLNKEAAGDTASFLFQTGFSGRAEIGLVGDNNFQFKTSPDGAAFTTGISISATDGAVSIPVGLRIPASAAPSVTTNGDIAIDTTVTDLNGMITYYSGGAFGVIAMPVASFASPTDGHVVTYDAATDRFKLAASGGGANAALSNLASVAINTTLLPGSNDGAALGSGTLAFSDLFLASGSVIDWNNGDLTLTHSANTLTLAGGNISFGTGNTVTLGNIEVGNASDTTISRNAAGIIQVEAVPLFSQIPQNSQSAAYTTVLADAQKHILHPTADNNARTFTIAANSSVAYPVGTCITFVNQINTVTIAITSDTLVFAGTGSTGSRTLAAAGVATALKIASTTWIISGTGLS